MRYVALDRNGAELGYFETEWGLPSDELKAEAIVRLGPDVVTVEEANNQQERNLK